MGKRSNFERVEKDFYRTIDPKAGKILTEYHRDPDGLTPDYYEPCYGEGDLVNQLDEFVCLGHSDITTGKDALTLTKEDIGNADLIITNPPWTRKILHPMIEHFRNLKPTWLLFDADWAHTKQAEPYLRYCETIISVGRLQWIPDTKMKGKDNVCWYLFTKAPAEYTEFINGNSLVQADHKERTPV